MDIKRTEKELERVIKNEGDEFRCTLPEIRDKMAVAHAH